MSEYICDIADFDTALDKLILRPFEASVQKAVAKGINRTARTMRDETIAEAPVYDPSEYPNIPHRDPGVFRDHIAYRRAAAGLYPVAVWYVKPPEYRLTHLLANGHRLFFFGRDTGKSARADEWVRKARDHAAEMVVPNIEREISRL